MKKNNKLKYSIALSSLTALPISASFEHLYFNTSAGYYLNFDKEQKNQEPIFSGKVGYNLDHYLSLYFKHTRFNMSNAQGLGLEYRKNLNHHYQLLHSISANSTKYRSDLKYREAEFLPEFGFGLRFLKSENYSIDATSSIIAKNDFSGLESFGVNLGINFGPSGSFGYKAINQQEEEQKTQPLTESYIENKAENDPIIRNDEIVTNKKETLLVTPTPSSYTSWDNIAQFKYDSRTPKIDSKILSQLKSKKYSSITLYGHTDNKGSKDYNIKLGYQRAESVRQELIKLGIDPNKIKVRSHGEFKPLVSNDNEANRAKNRRVSLEVNWEVTEKQGSVTDLTPLDKKVPLALSVPVVDEKSKQQTDKKKWNNVALFSKNSISAQIKPELIKELLLLDYKTIVLYGHTDNLGSSGYNISLGYMRAESVREQLIKHGIDSKRIKVRSKGAQSPLYSNNTENGRILNRRVSVDFIR